MTTDARISEHRRASKDLVRCERRAKMHAGRVALACAMIHWRRREGVGRRGGSAPSASVG